ncbi:ribonuclease H2 non-catalytic subunit-domain-containing protein [Butyriboletus roseoflavus]|nr:ribonuclease H2 non-catalytic subunit-domain-containing protein [Butyriboletus roseoflavus]
MSLEIAPVIDAGLLPACTPSLMPFHISYTGLAPISRYFRPRPAPPSMASSLVRSSSSATLVASSSSTSILSETESSLTTILSATSFGNLTHESQCGEDELLSKNRFSIEVVNQMEQVTATRLLVDTAMGMDSETQPALDVVPRDNSSGLTSIHTPTPRNIKRFQATFRGRQMYGQEMDIPAGYGGLVLRAPVDSKGKGKEDAKASPKPLSQKAKPKSKTRAATRQSKRTTVDDRMDEPERWDEGDCCSSSDVEPPLTRNLIPSSTFASFMLWTPDRPLDEGRDEYARALVEWTRLATEVSFLERLLYILDFVTLHSRRYIRMMNEDKNDPGTSGASSSTESIKTISYSFNPAAPQDCSWLISHLHDTSAIDGLFQEIPDIVDRNLLTLVLAVRYPGNAYSDSVLCSVTSVIAGLPKIYGVTETVDNYSELAIPAQHCMVRNKMRAGGWTG